MRLQQSIEYNTRGILQDIERLNEQKEQKINESRIARQKYKQAQAEILAKEPREAELKQKSEENENLVKKVKSQIEEIEQKKAKLLELLSSFQEEFDEHRNAWQEVHRSTEKARHALQAEQERLHSLEHDLKEIQAKSRSARERLLKVRYLSLKHYFEEVSHRLESAFKTESSRPRVDVAEKFRRARETDAGINELYTTLKEWQHIATSASQAIVRQTAEKELARVQAALERKFPGLFRQDSGSRQDSNLEEELFYYESANGERTFLMPVTAEHWRAIESNGQTSKAEPVMHLLWRIIKELHLDPAEAHFQCKNGLVELVLRNGARMSKKVNLILQLPESTISLNFLPLPSEIQESLKYETTDH